MTELCPSTRIAFAMPFALQIFLNASDFTSNTCPLNGTFWAPPYLLIVFQEHTDMPSKSCTPITLQFIVSLYAYGFKQVSDTVTAKVQDNPKSFVVNNRQLKMYSI